MNHYHPNNGSLAPVRTLPSAPARVNGSLTVFKQGVDDMLAKRAYFISQVLPLLKEGTDFFVIKGKKSLGKAGAEKLASIWNITARFEKDAETVEMLGAHRGLIAYRCDLTREGSFCGQGRGASTLEQNQGDPNKTVKMAQKRAFVDAIIRASGISDIFTQDLENSVDSSPSPQSAPVSPPPDDDQGNGAQPATDRQRAFLAYLVDQQCYDNTERKEKWLTRLPSMSKRAASRLIGNLLSGSQLI